jgi:hypothetical protein
VPPSAFQRRLPVLAVLAVCIGAGSAAALAWTNPTPEEYRAHAGEQLVAFASRELCDEKGLPMVLRLWIRDCPGLIASQQSTLADLAGRFTNRWNFVVGSVYTTRIGGQELLPGFAIPHAEVVTLAVAGRFVLLRTETSAGGSE